MKIKNSIIAFSVITIALGITFSLILSVASADKRSDESQTRQLIAQAIPDLNELPPFVKEVMEEEGISPEDLKDNLEELRNNPEIRAKIAEKMKKNRGEKMEKSQEEPGAQPKNQKAGGSKKGAKKGDGELAYYKAIVDNNLFRPLGWGKKEEGPPFALRATLISPNIPSASKAIIWVRAGNKERTVAIGDKIGGAVVEMITDDSVTLNNDEKPIELSMGGMVFLGKSAGGGGKGRRGGGGKQPQAKPNSPGSKRPGGNMQARFKQMSPEQRKKMAEEMKRSADSGGGGNRRGGGRRGGGPGGGRRINQRLRGR